MVSLAALWLPILLSAVIVFIASSIMHTVLTYHRSDYHPLPNEDKILAALRAAGLKRGLYIFPFGTPKEMKSPAMVEKYKQGPVGMMTVFPSGPPVMPKFLGLWFAYCLIVSLVVAFLAGSILGFGAGHHSVFHAVGLAAFLAYGVGLLSNGIWKGQPWGVVIKEVVDGLVYALLSAATFAYLWPPLTWGATRTSATHRCAKTKVSVRAGWYRICLRSGRLGLQAGAVCVRFGTA